MPTPIIEKRLRSRLESEGWTVIHKGWPDFLCLREREPGRLSLVVIEAKSETDRLSVHQKVVIGALRKAGVPCFVVGPNYIRSHKSIVHRAREIESPLSMENDHE